MTGAKQTKEMIRNNANVVLNLGLGVRRHRLWSPDKVGPYKRLSLYRKALSGFMKPGYYSEIRTDGPNEPALVVAGNFKSDAADSLLIWDMIVSAGQDCIAIFYPRLDDPIGCLMGPNSEAWGDFELGPFLLPATWLIDTTHKEN